MNAEQMQRIAEAVAIHKDRQQAYLHHHLSLSPEESIRQQCLEMLYRAPTKEAE